MTTNGIIITVERNIEHILRAVLARQDEREKNQCALTSNYSTRMETEANLKVRKKTRGFSHRDVERRVTRKRRLLDPTFT